MWLEIGAGTGVHALACAAQHPQVQLVAIERTADKFATFARALAAQPQPNLTALHADALPWVVHAVPPARLARWLLGQLHWMVPQGDQPVRTDTVARVAARLAVVLPQATPGTRVLPPDVLWAAAQAPATDSVVDDWLAGRPLTGVNPRPRW